MVIPNKFNTWRAAKAPQSTPLATTISCEVNPRKHQYLENKLFCNKNKKSGKVYKQNWIVSLYGKKVDVGERKTKAATDSNCDFNKTVITVKTPTPFLFN